MTTQSAEDRAAALVTTSENESETGGVWIGGGLRFCFTEEDDRQSTARESVAEIRQALTAAFRECEAAADARARAEWAEEREKLCVSIALMEGRGAAGGRANVRRACCTLRGSR